MIGQIRVKNRSAGILNHPGVNMFNIINIAWGQKFCTVGIFMLLGFQRSFIIKRLIPCYGNLNFFYDSVNIVKISSFRRININIDGYWVNGGEKFKWFFNPYF